MSHLKRAPIHGNGGHANFTPGATFRLLGWLERLEVLRIG